MRARTVVMATVVTAAGIAAGFVGGGSAAAMVPVTVPPTGGVGVELNHGETLAFADGPLPALIDQALPGSAIAVGVEHGSQLPMRGDRVVADLPSIVTEAAAKPNGRVALVLQPGPELAVVQIW